VQAKCTVIRDQFDRREEGEVEEARPPTSSQRLLSTALVLVPTPRFLIFDMLIKMGNSLTSLLLV